MKELIKTVWQEHTSKHKDKGKIILVVMLTNVTQISAVKKFDLMFWQKNNH